MCAYSQGSIYLQISGTNTAGNNLSLSLSRERCSLTVSRDSLHIFASHVPLANIAPDILSWDLLNENLEKKKKSSSLLLGRILLNAEQYLPYSCCRSVTIYKTIR